MNLVSLFAQSSPYYTQNMDAADTAATAGAIVVIALFMLIITVIAYVLMAFLLARIFKKVGIESWKAWVPIYNNWTFLELGGQKGYWAVLALVPIINIVSAVFMLLAMYRIGLNFGKEGAFVLVGVFVPLVWYAWLAFDSSTWKGPRPAPAHPPYTKKNPDAPADPRKK